MILNHYEYTATVLLLCVCVIDRICKRTHVCLDSQDCTEILESILSHMYFFKDGFDSKSRLHTILIQNLQNQLYRLYVIHYLFIYLNKMCKINSEELGHVFLTEPRCQ